MALEARGANKKHPQKLRNLSPETMNKSATASVSFLMLWAMLTVYCSSVLHFFISLHHTILSVVCMTAVTQLTYIP